MRRSNQITALVILAALVAVAVGVAVWPTPEEARADVTYTIMVTVLGNDQQQVPVEDVYVEFWFNGILESWGFTNEDGIVNYVRPTGSPWTAVYYFPQLNPSTDQMERSATQQLAWFQTLWV